MQTHARPSELRDARPSWLPADATPGRPAPCKCSPCTGFRCLCTPMFLVVFAIVALSYAPYVVWPIVWPQNTILSTLCITIFHILIALLLGSYVMCVFTDPGTVPPEWDEMLRADEKMASEHRFCNRSQKFRPLRSHFCSITRRVVLNMDHFCPCAHRAASNTSVSSTTPPHHTRALRFLICSHRRRPS